MNIRAFKFLVIERVLLPPALIVLKVLARTWRLPPGTEELVALVSTHPRVVVALWHGHWPALLVLVRLAAQHGRRGAVMTSPSRDGQVLDAILKSLGLDVVKGSSRSRAIEGTREMMRVVHEGRIGVLAVDGPRGPVGQPKPGAVAVAGACEARVFCLSATAKPVLQFRSWDRMFLPLPFADLRFRLTEFPLEAGEDTASATARLHGQLLADARALGSPIAPHVKEPHA